MKTQITRPPPAAVAAASGAGPSFFCLPPLWVIAVGFSHLGSGQMRHLKSVSLPDWVDVQIIPVNGAARRGEPMKKVTDIATTTWATPAPPPANRNYFAQPDTQVSAHFLVGLDGEVIQCIPLEEKSSATNERNRDTISIEVCHPDASASLPRPVTIPWSVSPPGSVTPQGSAGIG